MNGQRVAGSQMCFVVWCGVRRVLFQYGLSRMRMADVVETLVVSEHKQQFQTRSVKDCQRCRCVQRIIH